MSRTFIAVTMATAILSAAAASATESPPPAPSAAAVDAPQPVVVYIVRQNAPLFRLSTAASALSGVSGLVLSTIQGGIIQDNGIDDPANEMSREMARRFAAGRHGVVAPRPITLYSRAETLGVRTINGDYVVDVGTSEWGAGHLSSDWGHYGVRYEAWLTVTDAKSHVILTSGRCKVTPAKTPTSPTHAELVGNGAAGLKRLLSEASQECLRQFEAEIPSA